MSQQASADTLLFAFAVGERLFGIPATCVLEVSRDFVITRVPGAPRSIAGVINLRGEIVVAIDMSRRLGLTEPGGDSPPLCVFVTAGQSTAGMLVDRVLAMRRVEPSWIDSAAGGLENDPLVRGVARLPDCLMTLIEADEILPSAGANRSEITLKATSTPALRS